MIYCKLALLPLAPVTVLRAMQLCGNGVASPSGIALLHTSEATWLATPAKWGGGPWGWLGAAVGAGDGGGGGRTWCMGRQVLGLGYDGGTLAEFGAAG